MRWVFKFSLPFASFCFGCLSYWLAGVLCLFWLLSFSCFFSCKYFVLFVTYLTRSHGAASREAVPALLPAWPVWAQGPGAPGHERYRDLATLRQPRPATRARPEPSFWTSTAAVPMAVPIGIINITSKKGFITGVQREAPTQYVTCRTLVNPHSSSSKVGVRFKNNVI